MLIIDGYNLMYAQDFEDKDAFIEAIDAYCQSKAKYAKIIFDGYEDSYNFFGRVDIVFAGNADEYIKELLAENRSQAILVSSDKELLHESNNNKCKYIKSEDFNFDIVKKEEKPVEENEDFFLTDSEVEEQLKEFNNFKR